MPHDAPHEPACTPRPEVLLLDGGTGTELRARGVEVPCHLQSIWSAKALVSAPEAIQAVHRDYLRAGSNLITINNYAVTRPMLARAGLEDQLATLTQTAIDLAQRARDEVGRQALIAGALPPLQTSYRPDLVAPNDQLIHAYAEIAKLLDGQVDVLLCETLSSGAEARAAVTAALQTGARVWVSWTLQGDRINTLPSGETLAEAHAQLNGLRPDAFLVNCCGANVITEAMTCLRRLTTTPIGGYANAEVVASTNTTADPQNNAEERQLRHRTALDEAEYAEHVQDWITAGASIVGGCCGTRPSYISTLRKMLDARETRV